MRSQSERRRWSPTSCRNAQTMFTMSGTRGSKNSNQFCHLKIKLANSVSLMSLSSYFTSCMFSFHDWYFKNVLPELTLRNCWVPWKIFEMYDVSTWFCVIARQLFRMSLECWQLQHSKDKCWQQGNQNFWEVPMIWELLWFHFKWPLKVVVNRV